ncbi:MAG TPA: PQQ-binding-like beta-propeller repeat protein [Thermomicrobiales bacterium]
MFRSRNALRILVVVVLALSAGGTYLLAGRGGFAQEGGGNPRQQPATPSALGPAVPPEVANNPNDWVVPMGDYQAHRAAANSPISTQNVSQLGVAWSFPIPGTSAFGAVTSVPIVVGDTIYLQDMQSNVYALDRTTGQQKWVAQFNVPTEGPNGVAIGYGMLYGSLGNTSEVFAINAANGQGVWRVKLSNNDLMGIDMVPTVYNNVLYVSTVPGNSQRFYRGGGKGILYALDAGTGAELWEFDTTTDNLWGNARLNSGGGLWYPPSIDDQGNVYFGVGNAAPWPGVVADGTPWPNGSSRPGDNDYASSMVSLDPQTGAIRWSHNAKPHDLFDLDFQLTPIIATVNVNGTDTKVAIGSGKAGRVIAVNADTGDVLWDTKVGKHQNDDLQAIAPGQTVEVYPGTLGGVETPMAYSDGTVFVPVVNLSRQYNSTGSVGTLDYGKATGELVAIDATTGQIKWDAQIPTMVLGGAAVANDVVFTAGLDGMVRGFNVADGSQVFSYQAAAGINAPLAIAGDTLLVPAGGFLISPAAQSSVAATPGSAAEAAQPATPAAQTPTQNELIALRIGATGTPGATQPTAQPTQAPAATATGTTTAGGGQQGNAQTVTMVDIAFQPNALTIPANTDVTIQLTNQGASVHTFDIDQLNIHTGDVQPGQSTSVTINAPAGTYQYYCSIPGHKEAGMVGTLTVQ